jgi:hypothetical protein
MDLQICFLGKQIMSGVIIKTVHQLFPGSLPALGYGSSLLPYPLRLDVTILRLDVTCLGQ